MAESATRVEAAIMGMGHDRPHVPGPVSVSAGRTALSGVQADRLSARRVAITMMCWLFANVSSVAPSHSAGLGGPGAAVTRLGSADEWICRDGNRTKTCGSIPSDCR